MYKRHSRVIIAHSAQQIPNFTSKLMTHTKRKEIKEKKKREKGWNDHTRLGVGCT